jgi:alpha/beta superfamily hydrolase
MKDTRVTFLSGDLLLEGILHTPPAAGAFPAVIVCHPHPLYGGTMDSNVVCAVTERLTQESFVSLRFNFRGVGESQGEFGQGIGEQADVQAAISFVSTLREVALERIGLAGYSAGAGFALPIGSHDARIKALAAVSPPLDIFDFEVLKNCLKPKFLISGDNDDLISPKQFLEFCGSLPEPKECETIRGADHFWSGYESQLVAKVTAFFLKAL